MLQGLAERFQVRMGRLHLRYKGQVALAHLCSGVFVLIRQDLCRLVDQSVGLLERRPKSRRGLQAFSQEVLQLLQGWGQSFFPWTRAMESLTWVTRSYNRSPAASKGDRPSSVTDARTAKQ